MTKNKSSKFFKYCLITSTTAVVAIAISLIPISKKAAYWNRCLKKTVTWIEEKEMKLKGWDKIAIESLAVAVCNGAVYEPNFKS